MLRLVFADATRQFPNGIEHGSGRNLHPRDDYLRLGSATWMRLCRREPVAICSIYNEITYNYRRSLYSEHGSSPQPVQPGRWVPSSSSRRT